MSKLDELYRTKQFLEVSGYNLPAGMMEDIARLEEELIKDEVLPKLTHAIEPILSKLQSGVALLVEYKPDEPISVAFSREQDIIDIVEAKRISPAITSTLPVANEPTEQKGPNEQEESYTAHNLGNINSDAQNQLHEDEHGQNKLAFSHHNNLNDDELNENVAINNYFDIPIKRNGGQIIIPTAPAANLKREGLYIRIDYPDGHSDTNHEVWQLFVDCIKWIGPERVKALNIYIRNTAIVGYELSSKRVIRNAQHPTGKGLYISFYSKTLEKYRCLKYINDALNLGLSIQLLNKR